MADIKEKLVALLMSIPQMRVGIRARAQCKLFMTAGHIADHLIANGVTVGKPLAQFLHPVDAYAGLKAKYLVFKGVTGEKLENCFVLRPDKDPAAVEALRAYARTTENQTLAEDIYNWVGRGEPVQGWIPVTERMPKEHESVFVKFRFTDNWLPGMFFTTSDDVIAAVINEDGSKRTAIVRTQDGKWNMGYIPHGKEVTHWMPLPEPPKGE